MLPGAEAIGRQLLPLRDILSHLVQTNLPLTLRANYLRMLDEAYIYAKRPMEKSNDLVALINMFASRVEKFVSSTLPMLDRDFEQNKDEAELTEYVSKSVMKTFRMYIEAQFDPNDATNPETLLTAIRRFATAAASLDKLLRDDDCEVRDMIATDELSSLLKALANKELAVPPGKGNDDTLPAASTDMDAHEPIEAAPAGLYLPPPEKWHPQTDLARFIDNYKDKTNPNESEFNGLVDVFTVGLGDEEERTSTAKAAQAFGYSGANPPLANLVSRLQQPQDNETVDTSQTVTCARILRAILNNALATSKQTLHERQKTLNSIGVSAVVLRLVSCETTELYQEGLLLGVAMLKHGNPTVQDELVALLTHRKNVDIAAIDGSQTTFFARMRDSLRLAIKEIPERVSYLQMQKQAEEQFDDFTEGLAGATVELLRQEMRSPFVTHAHPELLLDFLQELVEGTCPQLLRFELSHAACHQKSPSRV